MQIFNEHLRVKNYNAKALHKANAFNLHHFIIIWNNEKLKLLIIIDYDNGLANGV